MQTNFAVCRRRGFSMLELVAVVTILGIIAAIVVPRMRTRAADSQKAACDVNRSNIEIQAQLWFRDKGAWPAANLSDIGADAKFFPDGLPKCPINNGSYTFNATTEKVNGHAH